MKDEV
jgi:serine/threonine protein kinase